MHFLHFHEYGKLSFAALRYVRHVRAHPGAVARRMTSASFQMTSEYWMVWMVQPGSDDVDYTVIDTSKAHRKRS